MNVTIVGGGNSAHVAIAMLSATGYHVSLLTRHVEKWQNVVTAEYQRSDGSVVSETKGHLEMVSSDPQQVIPHADLILFCLPVAKYRLKLDEIGPHIDNKRLVVVASVYGQAGFNWMVEEMKEKYALDKVAYFSYGLIPWIARTKDYGRRGITYGGKQVNVVAQSHGFDVLDWAPTLLDDLGTRLFGCGETVVINDFISLTLSVDNQVIHPSRCYGLYQEAPEGWSQCEDVPLFYRDYTDESADYLSRLDQDFESVRARIRSMCPNREFKYMLNYLDLEHVTYKSRSTSIKDSFVNSPTLTAISTPVEFNEVTNRWELIKHHRFFNDDTQYGICIVKWFADQLKIETPMIDAILRWVEEFKNQRFLSDSNRLLLDSPDIVAPFASGVPIVYGFARVEDAL
ncbi:MAG: NAD/NADP octopine/nopaline dehydrogenase family protein [Kiritimatiellia bacterium]